MKPTRGNNSPQWNSTFAYTALSLFPHLLVVPLEEYLELQGAAIGHADRREPLRAYLTGRLLAGERKRVEPMAAKIDPRHVSARHQSMQHFVAQAPWDERAVIGVAREYALEQLERHGPVAAWVVDDTALPKKGDHSVGVARQYCAPLGKQDNCQVAVTVSLANASMSVPCAYRLYLPESWARQRPRRRTAGVPDEIGFEKKWQLALAQIDRLLADDLPRRRWWRTPATVRRASFAKASARAACRTLWGLCTRPRFGPGGTDPCGRHVAVVAVGQPRACGAILIIGQFRCGRWPGAWTPAVGNPCAGAKAPRGQCSPVSRCSRSAWPIATICEWNHEYRNCC